MNSLFIALKLETPLLITGLGNGEENSSRSLSFIPGSALRGALISRYKANEKDLRVDSLADKLFFSNQVRFLNAYPLDENQNRMLPVPLSWHILKGQDLKKGQVADLALIFDPEKIRVIERSFRGVNTNQGTYAFDPEEELSIHTASQGRGIVQAGESTVFQYQALARGQRFGAFIVAEDAAMLEEMKKLLGINALLYLGRSRSAGYGKVLIENVMPHDGQQTKSMELPVTTITLLSDLILRDEHGQPTHDLDGYLSRRLDKQVKHQSAFIRATATGGFNRKWKLPLPQMPALGMGSVFVYAADQLTVSDLESMAQDGIGERRVDGFGQIAVNWPGESNPVLAEVTNVNSASDHPLNPASQRLAGTMSERLLRHSLELNLTAEAGRYSIKGNITNHQLARLRIILRQAIDSTTKEFFEITTFFSSLKKTAEDQWQKMRLYQDHGLAGIRLRLWVNERLEKQDGLQKILKIDTEADILNAVPKIAGVGVSITEQLKREYTLRLVEAVVDAAMKSNKEA